MAIKKKHIKQFEQIVQQLNALMEEICAYHPKAEIYVEDDGNFNLMKGPTHEHDGSPLHKNVVGYGHVKRSGGGGW